MLGKLIKYEFKATGRTLLPLYGAVLALSIINRIFIGAGKDNFGTNSIYNLVLVITLLGYVLLIAASLISTVIVIIQRFYKNLLKDEGYLMNTLPVSTSTNLWSKLIVSVAWHIICALVIFMSIGIFLSNHEFLTSFGESYDKFVTVLSQCGFSMQFDIFITIIEFIIFIIVGSAQNTIMFYASIAIGHLSNRRKVLCSFAAYIGLNMVISTITGIAGEILGTNKALIINKLSDFNTVSLYGCIGSIIITAILFVICNNILKNHLNLE